eukprot:2338427-Prorocentrum_lima.AAC.1
MRSTPCTGSGPCCRGRNRVGVWRTDNPGAALVPSAALVPLAAELNEGALLATRFGVLLCGR